MAVQAGPGSLGFFLGIAGAQSLSASVQSAELAVAAESSLESGEAASGYSPASTRTEKDKICPFSSGPENRLATGIPPARPVVLQSPSGLVTYPYEGADLARFARDILQNEARIPNRRIVIDTQHWDSEAKVDEDGLQCIAEEYQTTICLKTNAAPYVIELEPHIERERQFAMGELAALGARRRIKKERIEHSITLETMRKAQENGNWGTDRIFLDGIQNNLPGDSGGTEASITLKFGNRWYSRKQGLSLASRGREVEAVAFSDNGRGFSYQKLGIDYSDKPQGVDTGQNGHVGAVGQFGRGLKQATALALAEGMEMEILSRNWRAVPEWHPMLVDNKIVHRLCFDVEIRMGTKGMRGSRTIFHNPTQGFIDSLSQVERKVLYFRPNYKPIHSDGRGNAVVDESGDVLVKGVFITSDFSQRLLFGYDLNTEEIPSDRDQVRERVIGNLIGGIIINTADKGLIKAYLRSVLHRIEDETNVQVPMEIEHIALDWTERGRHWRTPAHPGAWRQAFLELFGDRAVLWTNKDAAMTAGLSNYDVIGCRSNNYRHFLANICGLPIDKKVGESRDSFLLADIGDASKARGHTFETSYTLSQRARKWGPLRLILDSFSNHTPDDSGGTKVDVLLKVPANPQASAYKWVKWSPGLLAGKIEEIQIVDDGRGYDYESLRYSFSDKASAAIGQNGEGLKMVSATALRAEDVKVKFRSRDWVATPFASAPKRINSSDQQAVCFRVLEGVDSIKGATTTIRGGDDDLRRIIDHLDDYVLSLRVDQGYLHSSPQVKLFRESVLRMMPQGTVYNKGIYITDRYARGLLFSYDLATEDVSPDRDDIDINALQSAVKHAVASLTDRKAIRRILDAASDGSGKGYMEFIDTTLDEEVAAVWKDAFYGLFGKDAVLLTKPATALEAMHLGFKVVEMNKQIARTLHAAGVEYDTEVINEGLIYDEVPYDDLTGAERETYDTFEDVAAALGLPHFENIKIFSKVTSRTGRDLSNRRPGFWNGLAIHINRSQLSSFAQACRIYIHERGHKETGSGDPTDRFRHFFEYNLAAFVGKELERAKGDPSYRVGIEGFSNSEQQRVAQLEMELLKLKAELEAQTKRAGEAEARLAKARKRTRPKKKRK